MQGDLGKMEKSQKFPMEEYFWLDQLQPSIL